MAVAFLPVFYSHLALNDVPALFPLMLSRLRQRGRADARTAARLRARRRRPRASPWRPSTRPGSSCCRCSSPRRCASPTGTRAAAALRGLALAGGAARSPRSSSPTRTRCSPSTSSGPTCASRRAPRGTSASSASTYDSGFVYYLWVLTWGLGLGAASRRRSPARCSRSATTCGARCSWCRGRSLFIVYMGTAGPLTSGAGCCRRCPALALLAALAAVLGCVDRLRPRARGRGRRCSRSPALAARGAGPRLQRAPRPRALARRHAQPRARVDGRERAAGLEDRRRADRPGRVVPTDAPDAQDRRRGLTPSGRRWVKFPTARTTIDEQGRTAARQRRAHDRDRGLRAHDCGRRWSAPTSAAATAGW